jgi:hypothetical protein
MSNDLVIAFAVSVLGILLLAILVAGRFFSVRRNMIKDKPSYDVHDEKVTPADWEKWKQEIPF